MDEEGKQKDARIAELEREVAALRKELECRAASSARPGEPPAIARLLADRALLSSLPDVISILDRQHRVLYLNQVVPTRTIEEFIGKNILDFIPEDQRAPRLDALERAWETGEVQTIESYSMSGHWWDTRCVPIVEDGRVAYLLTTAIEITERKRVEQALRESEERLRHAIDATGMGTWSSVRSTNQVVLDEALCRMVGLDPKEAPRDLEAFLGLVHPEDRASFVDTIESMRALGVFDEEVEFRICRPDGTVRHMRTKGSIMRDASGTVVGSHGGVFDITEQKQLEEHLRHVQKMEAVGQLTAGVAHNFNNILGVILPNVELCRRRADAEITARLDDIAHAGKRAAEMVRQLMLFARPEAKDLRAPIDLAESAERLASICRTTFDRRIAFELTIEEGIPSALANAGQIEQALLNICLNARDALEEARTEHPRIVLTVGRHERGALRIRVADNGPGMDEATRARIFEPFFTTKGVDRGTGLGLASAYAIVSDHRGRITCESRLGEGATFEILLPSTDRAPAKSAALAVDSPRGGSETLLLVDDEPLVRGAVRDLLRLGGYRVLEASDGEEGIATFERERRCIGAVILDRSMPGLSGEQVLVRLTEIDPSVPIVLLSGHPGQAEGDGRAGAVLTKPVSADVLLRTVRELLDRTQERLERHDGGDLAPGPA